MLGTQRWLAGMGERERERKSTRERERKREGERARHAIEKVPSRRSTNKNKGERKDAISHRQAPPLRHSSSTGALSAHDSANNGAIAHLTQHCSARGGQ